MKISVLLPSLLLLLIPFSAGLSCQSQVENITTTSETSAQAPQPVSGGTLRFITSGGPQMLAYPPQMSQIDIISIFSGVERLIDYSDDRDKDPYEPVLAESIEDDIVNRRMVFHLRPGVKFHDGSELDADVVIWNFERLVNAKALTFGSYWAGIKKLDDLTVEIDYTEYNNRLIRWGFTQIFSKAAWDQASGGDLQKGIEWARTHVVGTGPFMLKEYLRDDHVTWVKNPDYRVHGKPYLDAIEIKIIPDPTIVEMMMKAGEADFWFGAPVHSQIELVNQGFTGEVGWWGLPMCIFPNTADPNSKWNDIRLRQALEYALDKEAIANTFGPGYFIPMTLMAPPGEWGYDPDYPARNYDPEKARALLKDAGYGDGLAAKLLIGSDFESQNIGTAIKSQLDAVGFQIELDVADPGRFWGTVFGPVPGPDLVFTWSGTDITGFGSYIGNLSTYAPIKNSYLGHPPEQKALDDEALKIPDAAGQKAATQRLYRFVADNAMVIPIYYATGAVITPPYVHPVQVSNGGFRWKSEDVWMEPH